LLTILDELLKSIIKALAPYAETPSSTFFILGVAGALSIASNLANRFMVDVRAMKEISAEVKAWQEEFNRARKSGDKQLIAKATKKQSAMMRLQSKMMMDRMKVTLIFFVPFLLVWNVLSGFYGHLPGGGFTAFSPFHVPWLLEGPKVLPNADLPIKITYFTWYLLCSFAISLPLSRLLGTYPEQE
jgi:uncharacterized membrane protein (DUF106 family)